MGRFVYLMQNFLEIKDKMEQQAKNEFAAENIRVLEEEEKLQTFVHKRENLEMDFVRMTSTMPAMQSLIIFRKPSLLTVLVPVIASSA